MFVLLLFFLLAETAVAEKGSKRYKWSKQLIVVPEGLFRKRDWVGKADLTTRHPQRGLVPVHFCGTQKKKPHWFAWEDKSILFGLLVLSRGTSVFVGLNGDCIFLI